MKHWKFLSLLLLLTACICSTAHAKIEILNYEELLAIEVPCTVYVTAKTGDPSPMHMKDTLMDSIKWQWLVKDSSGNYRASGHYVNMTDYQAMSISTRGLILNHKNCRLEIKVTGPGQWTVQNFIAASEPITFHGVFWPILGLILVFALCVPLITRFINAPTTGTQQKQWRPSKLLLTTFFLSELFKGDGKKR